MDKQQLHHLLTLLRRIKVWYLVTALLAFGVLAVFALRQNNLGMIERREKVYQADQQAGDLEGALQELRSYVYGHMNTDLSSGANAVYPPIQLKYTYQRLKQAEQERVKQANAQIYTAAQAYCEQLYPGSFSGGPRVPCIEKYVAERGVREKNIPDALYKFDFASPSWSPDLAGFSVLFGLLAALVLTVRLGLAYVLKKLTR